MTDASLDCCEKLDRSSMSCIDTRAANVIVVTTVVLGLGSCDAVGKKNQYTSTCPGLKRQNILRHIGIGSHTESSQTSLVASGWDLASAALTASKVERKRSGEDDSGEESTRTR